MSPQALVEHARLHACCLTLHRAADAAAEELARVTVRTGPEALGDARAWIARNPGPFADLVRTKAAMLSGEAMPADLLRAEA